MGRPKQAEIPGTEQQRIAEIERAADKYLEKRAIWQGTGKELTECKRLLSQAMHKNADAIERGENEKHQKVLAYKRDDYDVTVTEGKEKVKVKIGDEETEEDNEE